MDENRIINFLEELAPADFDRILIRIPNANNYVPERENHLRRVEALLIYVRAAAGPGLERLREILNELFPGRFPETVREVRGVWNILPIPTQYFVGREEVIHDIRNAFESNRPGLSLQAITGLGGVGKTQTAIHYAYQYGQYYNFVFWVRAQDEISLAAGYAEIASLLQLNQGDSQNAEIAWRVVKQWLSRQDDYLLILDNVDIPDRIQEFIPHTPTGHILITSRLQDLAVLGINRVIPLSVLPQALAETVLLDIARCQDISTQDREAAGTLAQELGGLPLALEQVGAYIFHNRMSISDYLREYQRLYLRLLDERGVTMRNYSAAVRTIWNTSFDAVRSKAEASAELLNASAFLAPEGIPCELFVQGGAAFEGPLARALADIPGSMVSLNRVLEPLTDYSLIHRNAAGCTYDIHRLVQRVLQDQISVDRKEMLVNQLLQALNDIFPYPESHGEFIRDNWRASERLLPHIEAVAQHLVDGAGSSGAATLLQRAGVYLKQRGRYTEAERHYKRVRAIRERIFASEPSKEAGALLAETLHLIGVLYWHQDRYAEAEPIYKRSLALSQNADNLRAQAETMNHLGYLYYRRGYDDPQYYDEAEALHRQALAIRTREYGEDHLLVAASLNNIARVHHKKGQFKEAKDLFLAAQKIRERFPERRDLSHTLNGLANLYRSQKPRHDEAEALYFQALESAENALGSNHPDVARITDGLAELYKEQERYPEAEQWYRRTLDILHQNFDRPTKFITDMQADYDYVLRMQGRNVGEGVDSRE